MGTGFGAAEDDAVEGGGTGAAEDDEAVEGGGTTALLCFSVAWP